MRAPALLLVRCPDPPGGTGALMVLPLLRAGPRPVALYGYDAVAFAEDGLMVPALSCRGGYALPRLRRASGESS